MEETGGQGKKGPAVVPVPGILLLGFGHPLLDITANVDLEFLQKYGLEADNVILAGEGHSGLIDDLIQSFDVKFTAGGATQNAIRVAQWVLQKTGATAFVGSIGTDAFGKELKDCIQREGVREEYLQVCDKPTGTCVVLITSGGTARSLVSFPGAARTMQAQHLPWNTIRKSRVIYVSGFSIKSAFPAVLSLAQHVRQASSIALAKTFAMNLSAIYVARERVSQVDELLPFTDILFGNEGEIVALVQALGWQDNQDDDEEGEEKGTRKLSKIEEKAQRLADYRTEKVGGRCVIVTRAQDSVLVALTGRMDTFSFPVQRIDAEEIVDTNCAGDAFAGGFLGHYCRYLDEGADFEDQDTGTGKLDGRPVAAAVCRDLFLLRRCVKEGIFCAKQILKVSGCTLDDLWSARR